MDEAASEKLFPSLSPSHSSPKNRRFITDSNHSFFLLLVAPPLHRCFVFASPSLFRSSCSDGDGDVAGWNLIRGDEQREISANLAETILSSNTHAHTQTQHESTERPEESYSPSALKQVYQKQRSSEIEWPALMPLLQALLANSEEEGKGEKKDSRRKKGGGQLKSPPSPSLSRARYVWVCVCPTQQARHSSPLASPASPSSSSSSSSSSHTCITFS